MSLSTQNHTGRRLLTGLTALGSSQGTALALIGNADHEFTTVGSSTGAILPAIAPPTNIRVTNAGSNTLSIYPPVGGTAAGGSKNAAYSLTAGSTAEFYASSSLNYYLVTNSAGSGGTSPGGSNGQLQYNNSTAFGGAADIAVGAGGQLNLASIATPGTQATGDLWNDATQLCVSMFDGSATSADCLTSYPTRLVYQQNANVTISAAATTTMLSSTGATGTVSFPAGYLSVKNRTLDIEIFGYATTAASATGNCGMLMKLGSTIVATSFTNVAVTASKTTTEFRAKIKSTVKTAGSGGKLDTFGLLDTCVVGGSGVFSGPQQIQNGSVSGTPAPGTQGSLDLTAALALDLQLVLSAAVNTFVITNVSVSVTG
jgi:hypothetical protein